MLQTERDALFDSWLGMSVIRAVNRFFECRRCSMKSLFQSLAVFVNKKGTVVSCARKLFAIHRRRAGGTEKWTLKRTKARKLSERARKRERERETCWVHMHLNECVTHRTKAMTLATSFEFWQELKKKRGRKKKAKPKPGQLLFYSCLFQCPWGNLRSQQTLRTYHHHHGSYCIKSENFLI